ncbi:iron ABC transporter permease [Phyllobacterium sp. 0TCS1.6C]|uniref:FecCD family ABC transporter permease n=1 Tax=unclassified Phyllobacterium TaxID=2638441 RepID=UPI002264E894|nr:MULTISPECIES: iron ABC transporter permease [unclassified Phyllobacterium]MCX8281341.1 iron ABC transporter permease [Phyllobacterium sp. 0TCS1.6C]MCX8296003.1 iron ABC transporter permease [Phyllobacterium sp. 0TCS1.6A]
MQIPGRTIFGLGAGVVLIATLAVLSVAYGSTFIAPGEVIRSLAASLGLGGSDTPLPIQRIVVDLRLPRAVLAIAVGAGLGVIGAMLQTVTRNDLADPFLFGLSSGAAAGAVSVITVLGDRFGVWTLPLAAFSGGMLAAIIVLLLTRRVHGQGPERLILAGLAVSFIFAALTNYLVFAGDQRAAHSILFWTLGGLGLARWDNLPLALVGFAAIMIFALLFHRRLDAFLAGESTAESLGIETHRMRSTVFIVCAFSTAIFVSSAGVIGFVGLMIPHVARMLAGPLHAGLVLTCAMLGALLVLLSDLAARLILAPQELPIGIVTSSIGAFFVVWLLLRSKTSS